MKFGDIDIPEEVFEVKMVQYVGMPVGFDQYNRCQEIIKKYPEHFPWETKYNALPDEVHEAYRVERD